MVTLSIIRPQIERQALVNAFNSEGLHIEVEITYDFRQFCLRVRDDGRGIDPGVLEKGGRADHWGLQGMKERAGRIGAQLELEPTRDWNRSRVDGSRGSGLSSPWQA
jgi:nitrate/nitrite-specific signal transduction histidine kinase